MSYVKGKFKNTIFESESGYKVGLFKVLETDDVEIPTKTITYTGYFLDINKDEKYILYGNYIYHNRYGYQFATSNYEKIKPEGRDAIIDFLTSSFVKGCGEKLATKIYETFGDDALDKINENINNLFLVPSMSDKKAKSIYNSVVKYYDADKEILALKNMGFTIKETMNLINTYGKKIIDIIDKNIYLLTNEIDFKKLDVIFLENNSLEDGRRIKACIIEAMKNLSFQDGNIYLNKEEISEFLRKYYHIETDIDEYLKNLEQEKNIVIDNHNYYLMEDYLDEINNGKSIAYLMDKDKKEIKNFDKYLKSVEEELNIIYNEEQIESLKMALSSNISIITGGPGTGKTTIIKGLVKIYGMMHKLTPDGINRNLCLLAPTGRAAKRMSETSNLLAMTIHRFLKWDKENNTFGINEYNKESYNIYIIDEASMLDNHLLSSFFKGININTQIIFVGDVYQLPSVGPGDVLSDMIGAGVNHLSLKNIYRQSDNSYIPILASNIKESIITEDILTKKDDFSFISASKMEIKDYLKEILEKVKTKKIDLNKFQILAPMYKGENGIDNLNILLQEIYNPESPQKNEVKIGPITYRENDKVLNLVNDPDNNIYNGDIGFIEKIDLNSKLEFMIVNYYGHSVSYKRDELSSITHAYAMSIHKAQGSEFEHVIMPITSSYARMLYNKLLYTGVSRAKRSLVIIGSFDSFNRAILNNYSKERKTTLKDEIMHNIKKSG